MLRRRVLLAESLEDRRVLTASLGWDGPGLGSANLNYHIGETPSYLSESEVEAALQTALNAWSDVADITFTQTNRPGLRDSLDFSFINIDGRGGTLAQAYFPDDVNPARIAGDIQFDTSERWEIGNGLGRSAFDLVAVAVHEIGHALGLDHIHAGESILAPSISPNAQFTGLSEHDVEAIQALYAPLETSDPGLGDSAVDNSAPPEENSVPQSPSSTPDNQRDTSGGGRWFVWNPWNRSRWTISFSGFNVRWNGFAGLEASDAEGHNPLNPTDVNNDSETTPVDALIVINALNSGMDFDQMTHLCDTNNDGALSPADALVIINRLNRPDGEDSTATQDNGADGRHTDDGGSAASEGTTGDSEDEESQHVGHDHEEHHHGLDESQFLVGLGLGFGGRLGMLRDEVIESLFDAFDEDESGSLTENEVPTFAWNRMLDRGIDNDANGEITVAEIDAAILAHKQERFDAVDTNANGLLEESELAPVVYEHLQNADTNGDAGISFEELQAFQSLTRFQKLDANGDSMITQDEVSQRRWDLLLRFDDNGDSAISEDEFPGSQKANHHFRPFANLAARIFRFTRRFR